MGAGEKHSTLSGYEMKSYYGPNDIEPFDYNNKLGSPGSYPFTRGIRENMYRESLWVMGQYSGFASAEVDLLGPSESRWPHRSRGSGRPC